MDAYADLVRRLCLVRLKSREDTEDIFQTVFLKYLQHTKPFANAEHEKAWFIQVTLNACRDLLRFWARRPTVPLEALAAQAALALPVFLPGLLCAALSRTATSYCYATQRDRLACLLIYGEPAALLALLLLLPRALGLTGVWAAVPLSQLCTALAGAALLFRTHRAQHP